MPPALLVALVRGDCEGAGRMADFELTEELFSADPDLISILQMRLDQPITADETGYLTLHIARLNQPERHA